MTRKDCQHDFPFSHNVTVKKTLSDLLNNCSNKAPHMSTPSSQFWQAALRQLTLDDCALKKRIQDIFFEFDLTFKVGGQP
jgi:hypothetical protein